MIDALVLAGSLNNGLLQNVSQERYEALIQIAGKSMLSYVLKALQDCAEIQRIVVIGPEELRETLPPQVVWLKSLGTMMDNIQRGCAEMTSPFLLTTSDIPLLTPQAIKGFLELCGDAMEDLYFPLIPRELVERDFPGSRRTYVRFKEGVFTGGNLFLVNPLAVESCLTLGQELINLRKKPLALARKVGCSFLLKLLLNRMHLQEVQQRASGLLGIRGRAVICPYPEVGVDVDKPADFTLINRALSYELRGTIAANTI